MDANHSRLAGTVERGNRNRLISARFIAAAWAAMERPQGATVEELAMILGWRRVDVEEMLLGTSWYQDAEGNRVFPTIHYPDGTIHVPHFGRRRALPEIERREGTTVLKLRRPEPTDPVDRVKHIAALITANARLGDAPTSSTLQQLADAIDDVRKADPNLSVDQIATATHVPKKIVEALLDRAK